jgi:hypothetical protein
MVCLLLRNVLVHYLLHSVVALLLHFLVRCCLRRVAALLLHCCYTWRCLLYSFYGQTYVALQAVAEIMGMRALMTCLRACVCVNLFNRRCFMMLVLICVCLNINGIYMYCFVCCNVTIIMSKLRGYVRFEHLPKIHGMRLLLHSCYTVVTLLLLRALLHCLHLVTYLLLRCYAIVCAVFLRRYCVAVRAFHRCVVCCYTVWPTHCCYCCYCLVQQTTRMPQFVMLRCVV